MTDRTGEPAPPPRDDGRRFAPSAARNAAAIAAALAAHMPGAQAARGRALELASGTGQHVAGLAAEFPAIDWQPSDLDPGNLPSIRAWGAHLGPTNLRGPVSLDACRPDWSAGFAPFDLVLAVNLLHLVTQAQARAMIEGLQDALRSGGMAALYGPFLRDGVATSPGDAEFHARLTAEGRGIGYKDVADVQGWLDATGLQVTVLPMPANNLMLIARRTAA